MIDHFIDIFSKLEIGVISFAAPITTYILNTLIEGRTEIREKLQEQKKQTDNLLKNKREELKNDGATETDIVKECNKLLYCEEMKINKKIYYLNYINPKKRIIKLFLPFFLSIILLLFDVLIRDGVLGFYAHSLTSILITLSCLLFIVGMAILWDMVWKLIDAKEMLADDVLEFIKNNNAPKAGSV